MDLETAESLRINKWELHQHSAEDNLISSTGEPFMILQRVEHIMTSCGRRSLLLGDPAGTLKDLIMTLYRCHLCHL